MKVLRCVRHTSYRAPSSKPHASTPAGYLVVARARIIPPSIAKIHILANTVLHFAVYDQNPARWDKSCNEHLMPLSRPDGREPSL
jgi:hypothetical protein